MGAYLLGFLLMLLSKLTAATARFNWALSIPFAIVVMWQGHKILHTTPNAKLSILTPTSGTQIPNAILSWLAQVTGGFHSSTDQLSLNSDVLNTETKKTWLNSVCRNTVPQAEVDEHLSKYKWMPPPFFMIAISLAQVSASVSLVVCLLVWWCVCLSVYYVLFIFLGGNSWS